MGMTGSEASVLSLYEGGRTKKQADKERRADRRYFDQKETKRYREALADLTRKGKEARQSRVAQRQVASAACATDLQQTKERTKDKPPYRRRAEVAKSRTDCAFNLMNIEEATAQTLEGIAKEKDKEVGYRRSSRISSRHNRQREKERAARTKPRELREDMWDRVRNDLEPDLLPFFEENKQTPAFKKLCDSGRMTPTEAVLQMAHDDPEAVFAALERYVEKELQKEIERFENEGGRTRNPGEGPTPESTDSEGASEERTERSERRESASRGRKPSRGSKTSSSSNGKSGQPRTRKRGRSAQRDAESAAPEAAEASPESEAPKSGIRRSAAAGKSPRRTDKNPDGVVGKPIRGELPRFGTTTHASSDGTTMKAGIERDGDEFVALTFTGARHFKKLGAAIRYLENRGFHPDGTVFKPAEPPSKARRSSSTDSMVAAKSEEPASQPIAATPIAATPIAKPTPAAEVATPSMHLHERRPVETLAPASMTTSAKATTSDVTSSHARDPHSFTPRERAKQSDQLHAWVREHRLGLELDFVRRELRAEHVPYFNELLLTRGFRDLYAQSGQSLFSVTSTLVAQHPTEVRAALDRAVRSGRFPEPVELGGPNARRELLRAIEGAERVYGLGREVDQLRSLFAARFGESSPVAEASSKGRPSAVERTAWIPGTEPRPALPQEPSTPARTTLFEDTLPETPDAKRRHEEKGPFPGEPKEGKDPFVQQAFGTDYASWLDRSGPQMTLDAARPAASAQQSAKRGEDPPPRDTAHAHSTMHASNITASGPGSAVAPAPSNVAATTPRDTMPSPAQLVTPSNTNGDAVRVFGMAKLHIDRARRLLQVSFERIPSRPIRLALRSAGFRWTPAIERWQGSFDEARLRRVEDILRSLAPAAATSSDVLDATLTGDDGDTSASENASQNPYEQRQASRITNLRERAEDLQASAAGTPSGKQALALQGQAQHLLRRAEAAEHNKAISSDDPEAIPKLHAKIAEKERFIDRAHEINAVITTARRARKTGWEAAAKMRLEQMGLDAAEVMTHLTKNSSGRYGISGSDIQNARGEIQRLEYRIRNLERRDARPQRAPERIGEATLIEDKALNRIQIKFDGVPPKQAREVLRGAGFLWAPTQSAWQRKLTEGAHWKALQVLNRLYPQKPPAAPSEAQPAAAPPSVAETSMSVEAAPAPPAPATPTSQEAGVSTASEDNALTTSEGCDDDSYSAEGSCACASSKVLAGTTVYAVTTLTTRDKQEVPPGTEGIVVDVFCDDRRPPLFLVRWGNRTPSWYDATEISTDPNVPF